VGVYILGGEGGYLAAGLQGANQRFWKAILGVKPLLMNL
jgi:hypothetical protein